LCSHYITYDIIEPFIKFNKKYGTLDADFRVLDLTGSKLQGSNGVFISSGLGLSQACKESDALREIFLKCKYIILTEHLAGTESFNANSYKPGGRKNRRGLQIGAIIRTTLYQLKDWLVT
jgi:hypothetical protein